MSRSVFRLLPLLLLAVSACGPIAPSSVLFPSREPSQTQPPTSTEAPSATATPEPSRTRVPTPTSTPPALPGIFQTARLNPLDTPHTYIQDTCQVLHDRWSSTGSLPGTVVMVIMFHRITDGPILNPDQISEFDFRALMRALQTNGFQAIDTRQLEDFLEHNARIPPRSVLLVTDDKHTIEYFDGLFKQYWQAYGWPVVNAWISDDLTSAELWNEMESLNAAGWVDYQAHGVQHIAITSDSTDAYIQGELQGSIDVFREHFHKTPIAFVWPGGGFTPHAVQLARQAGYRLGFTTNPRGPLLYNWIPLAEDGDPARPTWIPEGAVHDPLMVLPRYWDTDAAKHLDEVVQLSKDAAAFAEQNKPVELAYYQSVCAEKYGPLP
jgi:hypothetical protein